jgi:hypothetical protein
VLLSLALISWFILRDHETVPAANNQRGLPGKLASDPADQISRSAPETSVATVAKQIPPADSDIQQARDQQAVRTAAIKEAEATNVPVTFYGKVIDQYNEPVAGVEVGFTIRSFKLNTSSGEAQTNESVQTDSQGIFVIHGIGHDLDVVDFKKAGYIAPTKERQGSYNYASNSENVAEVFQADPRRPVVYRISKLEGPQQLESYTSFGTIGIDGKPKFLDVKIGPVKERIHLEFRRGPILSGDPIRYDWTLTAQVEGGTVVVREGDLNFTAPSDGYREKLTAEMKAENPKWSRYSDVRFFVHFANGTFGRFAIGVSGPLLPEDAIAEYTIEGKINPTGSRNLEPGYSDSR